MLIGVFLVLCLVSPIFGQSLLRDGVLVDTDKQSLFVYTPDKGVAKVRLSDGTVLWKNEKVDQPLGVIENSLIAFADATKTGAQPQLVFLNQETGQTEARSAQPLAMADRVWQQTDASMDQSLKLGWVSDATGFQLTWESISVNVSPIPGGQSHRNRQESSQGSFQYHWSTQSLTTSTSSAAAPAVRPNLVRNPSNLENVGGPVFASNDDLYYMVPKRTGEANVRFPYEWEIFDASNGTKLGFVSADTTWMPFSIQGDLVIQVAQPYIFYDGQDYQVDNLHLRVMNLKTQKEVWRMDIRDTTYRGPLPP
jgi:hypothetical protein